MNEPKYRLRIEIYDDEVGEVVSRIDEPLCSTEYENEDNIANLWRVIRRFNGDERTRHEMEHYPKDEKDYE